jgi:hypothetical protein
MSLWERIAPRGSLPQGAAQFQGKRKGDPPPRSGGVGGGVREEVPNALSCDNSNCPHAKRRNQSRKMRKVVGRKMSGRNIGNRPPPNLLHIPATRIPAVIHAANRGEDAGCQDSAPRIRDLAFDPTAVLGLTNRLATSRLGRASSEFPCREPGAPVAPGEALFGVVAKSIATACPFNSKQCHTSP